MVPLLFIIQSLQTPNHDVLEQAWEPRRGSLTLGGECPSRETATCFLLTVGITFQFPIGRDTGPALPGPRLVAVQVGRSGWPVLVPCRSWVLSRCFSGLSWRFSVTSEADLSIRLSWHRPKNRQVLVRYLLQRRSLTVVSLLRPLASITFTPAVLGLRHALPCDVPASIWQAHTDSTQVADGFGIQPSFVTPDLSVDKADRCVTRVSWSCAFRLPPPAHRQQQGDETQFLNDMQFEQHVRSEADSS